MKIALARHAGFCFGVRRSVDAVNALLNQGCRPTTLGPVIHNPTVVEAMRARGAVVAESLEQIQGDTVVIRSHGEAEAVHEALRARGLTIVDTTCPFVARIHRRVKEASQAGLPVVIVGEAGHAEVEGILGWVQGTARYVVGSEEEARALPEMEAACIVAQTTTPKGRYDAICKILQGRIGRCEIFDSICQTTVLRQSEAQDLASRVDAMLVIGGRNSSNTRKLFALCEGICPRTYFLERAEEVALLSLRTQDTIGITAGASTPDEIIKEVVTRMSELDKTITPQTDAPVEAQENPQDSEFASEFEKTLVSIRPGQTVTGTIVQV